MGHRLLYSQIYIQTKVPKYIFISINNFNGSNCTGYNKLHSLYNAFISYILRSYDIKIKKYFSNSTHLKQKEEILKTYKDMIVSFMDGDDITHPQKFEILDHLYSVKQINGTVLHRLYRRDCHIITH